jgi:hypothetical protein
MRGQRSGDEPIGVERADQLDLGWAWQRHGTAGTDRQPEGMCAAQHGVS